MGDLIYPQQWRHAELPQYAADLAEDSNIVQFRSREGLSSGNSATHTTREDTPRSGLPSTEPRDPGDEDDRWDDELTRPTPPEWQQIERNSIRLDAICVTIGVFAFALLVWGFCVWGIVQFIAGLIG